MVASSLPTTISGICSRLEFTLIAPTAGMAGTWFRLRVQFDGRNLIDVLGPHGPSRAFVMLNGFQLGGDAGLIDIASDIWRQAVCFLGCALVAILFLFLVLSGHTYLLQLQYMEVPFNCL